ncbi:MAG: hypothetical protein RMJ98_01900 [Myxococcales bacterium]|nr:hypothetical protein [Myxococcales bacterium]
MLLLHAAGVLGITAVEPAPMASAEEFARRLTAPGSLPGRLTGGPPLLTAGLAGLGRHLAGPSLTALRAGGVALAAAIPVLVYFITLPRSGRWLALAAGLLALLVPRALLEGATLGGDGTLTALLWAGFWAHLSSRGRPDRAFLAGVLLAGALSVAWGALLALPTLVLHHVWTAPGAIPSLRHGRLPLPLSAALFLLLAPLVFWLLTPALWTFSSTALRDILVAAASPEILPGEWAGDEVTPDRIPRFHTLGTLLTALPSWTTLLAVAGLVRLRADGLRRCPELALAVAALLVFGGWPLLCPPGLGRFPGHFLVLIPAAALLASRGVAWLLQGPLTHLPWPPPRRALLLASVMLGGPLLACTIGAPSLSADFSWITGGPWRPARWGPEPLHDGSPLGALLLTLDALGSSPARVYAPEIPPSTWRLLQAYGRLHRTIQPVSRLDQADFAVLSGGRPAAAGFTRIASLHRDGQEVLGLWYHGTLSAQGNTQLP